MVEQITVIVTTFTLKTMMVKLMTRLDCSLLCLVLLGLRFELLEAGIIVDEDVGTVELCVTYGGDNVPPTIDAYFYDYDYRINICVMNQSNLCVYSIR